MAPHYSVLVLYVALHSKQGFAVPACFCHYLTSCNRFCLRRSSPVTSSSSGRQALGKFCWMNRSECRLVEQLLLDWPGGLSVLQTGIVLNRPVLRGEDGDKAAPPPMSAQVRGWFYFIRWSLSSSVLEMQLTDWTGRNGSSSLLLWSWSLSPFPVSAFPNSTYRLRCSLRNLEAWLDSPSAGTNSFLPSQGTVPILFS